MRRPIPFGKYYLLDRVNVGGMAEVFRAKAFGVEGFERIVAVKRILPSIAEDTDFITMFIDEAKIAVQLNHANIAQIFDLGKVGDAYFIALEYVHGKDLRAVFDLARKEGHPPPVGLSVYAMMKVCEGLDYAHNKKDASGRDLELVHRDVSPQNILLSFDGEVKLIDFGIAKAVGKAGKTQAGILKGKFGYLSPEQVRGENIDRRSDVFGVGIVLYELLTGERLFAGDSDFSTIEKVRSIEISAPSRFNKKIPKELENIVLRALSRDLAVRYQTAMELHDELQKFLYARGESFGRRDLSAWMRAHFAEDAQGDQEAVGDLGSSPALRAESTDVAPILEPAESKAVINETREAPAEQGKPKNKSTIVGMPAVLPPADLAAPKQSARSVPPPPPRGDMMGSMPPRVVANPGAGRSVPPPPPRAGVAAPAPASVAAQAVTPVGGVPVTPAIPSVAVRPSIPTGAAQRSVPPPPPRASVPPSAPAVAQATTEPTPAPAGANPVLDMDWDDEELSTQIYDRPEDQLGMSGTYENVESGYEDLAARPDQSHVATYVPPSNGMANGLAVPGMQVSAKAYAPVSDPPLPVQAPANSRAAQVTQPIVTQTAVAERNRNPLYAALAVAAVIVLCFIWYVVESKTQPGVVQLTTHPTDATVLFDGEPVGTMSPYVKTGVAPGEKHLLEVKKDGYRPWSQEVQVQPGQTLEFPVTLQAVGLVQEPVQPPPSEPTNVATGGFSLESTPPGAKVFLDGKDINGVTPLRVANLVPRTYEVVLKLPNFREQSLRVDVRSGVDVSLSRVMLEPERLQVRITSEPPNADAAVVRGDERRELGRTPLSVSLDNNGVPWSVEVQKDGFERFAQAITPDGANEVRVSATLIRSARGTSNGSPVLTAKPRRARESSEQAEVASSGGGSGTLRINSRPWSQVYVDGKLIGNTPQMNVSLSEGSHRITLTNPEFGLKKNITIKIAAGETITKIENLQ